ncbi:hypothetical protein CNY89_18500 [Amaricoccus sp. HAR-UPW-R2A-40]|nr:hypothetical protein CNY89_18500 [Amaricoccus sp. HAR-UPW-R2A-40]
MTLETIAPIQDDPVDRPASHGGLISPAMPELVLALASYTTSRDTTNFWGRCAAHSDLRTYGRLVCVYDGSEIRSRVASGHEDLACSLAGRRLYALLHCGGRS